MARKKKCSPVGASNAYLISFGDTMTALLAFFIVLNALAEDQTGANLHTGTGSFIQALNSLGLSGLFDQEVSSSSFPMDEASPKYVVPDEDGREPDKNATGPDDTPDHDRVIDREHEQHQRFLNEVQRLNSIEPLAPVVGEIAYDVMEPIQFGEELPENIRSLLNGLGPVLRGGQHEVVITIWAGTPSRSAWTRALSQGNHLRKQTVDYLGITNEQAQQITATSRAWLSPDIRRPTLSVVIRRVLSDQACRH